MTFNEWLETQGNFAFLHANCCRIAFEGGQQSMQVKVDGLKGQLIKLGFTDNGGQLMKPPLGMPPRFDLIDEIKNSLNDLAQKYRAEAHELALIRDFDKSQIYSHFVREIEQLLKGAGTQNKYDWALIPEHVNFMATDEDGMACGWLVEPHIVGNAWRNQSHLSAFFTLTKRQNPFRGDWKDSLEKRPDYVEPVLKDGA
ncbi:MULTISPECIES: hypothetical protein [Acinetobacter calcoaceticus/baumannii complex]|uniref:hypothetical protein n=1 Tax=Acinetobacter calcoaceticus/baumannii complex TaxID=909768 RepID=UPI00293FD484|nr:hypothetical protein [Acinetobacter baumannii]MDV4226305.1 hypothetical protein [Acinetobacter baumannii]